MKAKITLVLVALLLTGWGCQEKSSVSNQPQAGQDTVASVDTAPSPDTAKPTDTSALDTAKSDTAQPDTVKPKDTSPADIGAKDVSNVPEGWKVYKKTAWGLQFAYPSTWLVTEDSEIPSVDLIAPENKPAPGFEPIPDIRIWLKANPKKLALNQFYDGKNDTNLGADAVGGQKGIAIDSFSATRFFDVIGEMTADIIVVPREGSFLEIQFRGDSKDVFEQWLATVQLQ